MNKHTGTKRVHNGTIGESRTKSFLLDRFWILERSVDIEGADFIIQRRLLGQGILDAKPPRFGVVQSKFSQDERTRHNLRKDYVVNKQGEPYMEFFLIVNIGYEDSQKTCLLSAKNIVDCFELNDGYYNIPTKLLTSKFLVESKKRSLDYIENSIKCAEFYKNRMYVFSKLESIQPDLDAIHPDYATDIDYVDGKIPDLFKNQKIVAYNFMLEIEKIHSELANFVKEVNPIESCFIAESFNHNFHDTVKIPQIFDKEFYFKAQRHIEQINQLKNDGVIDKYLFLKKKIKDSVNNFLCSNQSKINSRSQHTISIKYNPYDFSDEQIKNEITSDNNIIDSYYGYQLLKEGEIVIIIKIGVDFNNKNLTENINELCLIDIMEKIYELKYFENNSIT